MELLQGVPQDTARVDPRVLMRQGPPPVPDVNMDYWWRDITPGTEDRMPQVGLDRTFPVNIQDPKVLKNLLRERLN